MEFLTVSTIHLTGLVAAGATVTGIVLIAAAATLIGKAVKKNRKNRLQQLQKQLDKRLPVVTAKEKENQVNSDRQEFIRNERKKYQDWLNNGRPSEKPTTEGVVILSEPEHEIVPVPEDNKVLSKEIEPPLVATVKSEDVLPKTEEKPPEIINDEMSRGSLLLTNKDLDSNDSTVRPVLIGDLLLSTEESHDSDAEPYQQTVQADTEESLQPQDSKSNMINLALLPSKDLKSLMDAQPLLVTSDEQTPKPEADFKKLSNGVLVPAELEPILVSEDVSEKETGSLDLDEQPIVSTAVEPAAFPFDGEVEQMTPEKWASMEKEDLKPYEGEIQQINDQKLTDIEPKNTDNDVNNKIAENDYHSLDLAQRPTPKPVLISPVDNFQKGPVERMVKDAWVEVDTSPPSSPPSAVESPIVSELVNVTKPTPMALVTAAPADKVLAESTSEQPTLSNPSLTSVASKPPQMAAPEKVKPSESDVQASKMALLPNESPIRAKVDETNSLDLDQTSLPKESAVQPVKVPYDSSVEQITKDSWDKVLPDL